jgi:hypothetical protein
MEWRGRGAQLEGPGAGINDQIDSVCLVRTGVESYAVAVGSALPNSQQDLQEARLHSLRHSHLGGEPGPVADLRDALYVDSELTQRE